MNNVTLRRDSPLKGVFMGSPQFAVPIVQKLLMTPFHPQYIVTQPDKKKGRDNKPTPCPVKAFALEQGYADDHILQPDSLKTEEMSAQWEKINPDLIVVAAYGKLLPKKLITLPRFGCINVHGSLLPAYRGASPVAGCLLNGDKETGITIMKMDERMDTGPIIAQQAFSIVANDTRMTLSTTLSKLGANLLLDTLPRWIEGILKAKPQDDKKSSYTKLLRKEDGRIDWNKSAIELERQIRAYYPWPGSWTLWKEKKKRIVILQGEVVSSLSQEQEPGSIIRTGNGIGVITGEEVLLIKRLQVEGKKEMGIEEFLRGQKDFLVNTFR